MSGHNLIEMTGQEITDSFIKNSELDQATLTDSSVKRSRLQLSRIDDSHVVNSDVMNSVVTKDSTVELSKLMSDEVTAAMVGGVHSGWALSSWEIDERTFTDGYFVGNGKDANHPDFNHGYVQVADEDAYVDGLAALTFNRDLPYAWDLEAYRPSDALKERLEEGFVLVPDDYKDETLEMAPFLKDVIEPTNVTVEQSVVDEEIARDIEKSIAEDTACREADGFAIDESQFDVTSQQGLQQ